MVISTIFVKTTRLFILSHVVFLCDTLEKMAGMTMENLVFNNFNILNWLETQETWGQATEWGSVFIS